MRIRWTTLPTRGRSRLSTCAAHRWTARRTSRPWGLTALILDVFRHAPQGCFRRVQIARSVDGDAFPHGAVGRIRFVGWDEHHHLAVFETADPNPLEPARVNPVGRL